MAELRNFLNNNDVGGVELQQVARPVEFVAPQASQVIEEPNPVYAELAKFSETAAKIFGDQQKKFAEDKEAEGFALGLEDPPTEEETKDNEQVNKELNKQDRIVGQAAYNIAKNGGKPEVVNRVMALSPWQRVGYAKAVMYRAAQGYGPWLNNFFKENIGKIDDASFQGQLVEARKEYLRQSGVIYFNKKFVKEELYTQIFNAEQLVATRNRRVYNIDKSDQDRSNLKEMILTGTHGEGFVEEYASTVGSDGETAIGYSGFWRDMNELVRDQASAGNFQGARNAIDNLRKLPSEGNQKLGERFKSKFLELDAVVTGAQRAKEQQDFSYRRLQAEKAELELVKLFQNKDYTSAALEYAISQNIAMGGDAYKLKELRQGTREQVNKAQKRQQLDDLLNRRLLRPEHLNGVPEDIAKDYRKEAEKNAAGETKLLDQYKTAIEDTIKNTGLLASLPPHRQNQVARDIKIHLKNVFIDKFNANIKGKFNGDPSGAADQAYQDTVKLWQEGQKDEGNKYSVGKDPNRLLQNFQNWLPRNSSAASAVRFISTLEKALDANGNNLERTLGQRGLILTQKQAQELMSNPYQAFPRTVQAAAERFKTSPYQVVNRQIKAWFPGARDLDAPYASPTLDPKAKERIDRLINTYQSQNRQERAQALISGNTSGLPTRTRFANVSRADGFQGSTNVQEIGRVDAQNRPIKMSSEAGNAFNQMIAAGMPFNPRDVANVYRTPQEYDRMRQAGYSPAANSAHNYGEGIDVHGATGEWLKKNGARYGWYYVDYEGTHGGHFEYKGTNQSSQATPTTRRGGGMTGIASYYTGSGGSDGVAGGATANGERYNPNAMTAAVQRSLRGKYLNKWLIVEDLESGKSVRVWANDVGSMGGDDNTINRQDPRVVDLSPAAFKRLYGDLGRGLGRIRVRIDPNQRRG